MMRRKNVHADYVRGPQGRVVNKCTKSAQIWIQPWSCHTVYWTINTCISLRSSELRSVAIAQPPWHRCYTETVGWATARPVKTCSNHSQRFSFWETQPNLQQLQLHKNRQ